MNNDYLMNLKRKLEACPHGKADAILNDAQTFLGISRQTLYTQLQDVGYKTVRKKRTDAGKTTIELAELETISGLIRESRRANNKQLLSIKDAAQIARSNGLLQSTLSISQISRKLSQHNLHPKQLIHATPSVELKTLHPNHLWQFDVSICVLYYLNDGGLGVMDSNKFYKNKPHNIAKVAKHRVLRYLMTDHTSSCFYLKYYVGSGETQEILFDFLMSAFHKRTQHDLMHGVPQIMLWDAGSANTSHMITNILKRLDVRVITHMPGNPRAKGQVESMHNVIERQFEARLTFQKVNTVDELNQHASNWRLYFLSHFDLRRAQSSRHHLYQRITHAQLRLCPPIEICRQLLQTKVVSRKVNQHLHISFQVKGYKRFDYDVSAIESIRIGDQLSVVANPYNAPNIYAVVDVDGMEQHIECQAIERDEYGFAKNAAIIGEQHQKHKDTPTDTAKKNLDRLAFGDDNTLEIEKKRKKRALPFDGQIDPFTYPQQPNLYIPKKGSEMNIPNPKELQAITITSVDAMKTLQAKLPNFEQIKSDLYAHIKADFPDGLTEYELEQIIAEYSKPQRQQIGGLRII